MTQIAYSGSFWTQFRVLRDLFTDLTAGEATVRTFLPRQLTAASRIQNCTYRKIIAYQNPQLNLPIDTQHKKAHTQNPVPQTVTGRSRPMHNATLYPHPHQYTESLGSYNWNVHLKPNRR